MKTPVKIVLAIVLFVILAGIVVAFYLYNLKPKDLNRARPDYTLTASDLLKYFEENESVATAKYVNKIVEVSGEISSVKPGENNSLNISLKTDNANSSVICTLAKAADPSAFKAGSRISVRGVCSGYLLDVLLNNCTIPETSR